MDFKRYRVSSRRDVLHFVEEFLDPKVYEKLGKEPQKWVDELNIVYGMITGEPLCASTGIDLPPQGDKDFQRLGDDVFLYRGSNWRLRGLWVHKTVNDPGGCYEGLKWAHYRIGSTGTLRINTEFDDIPFETFLPDNFEPRSRVVKKDKRNILSFDVEVGGRTVNVFAKGNYVATSHYYDPPNYRLTNLSGVVKVTSNEEMARTLKLAERGVKVPKVIGYYETPLEEFLFLQKVEGSNPSGFLQSHRKCIIEQDARMLAVLCLLGYRKVGFEDFEDKLFDGKELYLVDTEEFEGLYNLMKPDFKSMLINPSDTRELRRFRNTQRQMFKSLLKDAVYRYRNYLTPSLEDQVLYVNTFYDRVGWSKPKESEVKKLLHFPKDYMTLDAYICMMTED